MDLSAFNHRDLQNLQSVVLAVDPGMDLAAITAMIEAELATRNRDLPVLTPVPAASQLPDNLTHCQVCGKPAVIVPLSKDDRTEDATHAIQCQNRPPSDQPWRAGMCGHTEYIVRGDK